MDPSGLITILGFFAAVIAIIPRERRLDLRIRFSFLDLLVIIFSLVVIHYILYFDVFKQLGIAFELGQWRLGFNQSNTIYLIFLALSIFLLARAKFSKIKQSNIHLANELFEQLLFEEKYFEVALLTEKYLNDIVTLSKKESFLNLIARKIRPVSDFELRVLSITPSFLGGYFHKQRVWLASKMEHEDAVNEAAGNILRRLVNNIGFVKYISISKPYIGLKIIKEDTHFTAEFVDNFIDCLMDFEGSIYYYELEHNYTNAGHNRFQLSKNNKLLYYLFNDVTISERLGIYQPIGEKVCNLLDYNKEIVKKYNQPLGTYYEKLKFKCPIDSSIHFFEIMILESMHQGIRWHMWLYYFPIFTRKILDKLNPDPEVDLASEWPTPFHYILYHIVKAMLYWLDEFSHVENKQALEMDNQNLAHDNGSIPKSTVLALGNILHDLISSNSISNNFKVYVLEIVMRHIRDSLHDPHQETLNSLLMKSIVLNGFYNKVDENYIHQLATIYGQVDHVIRFELTEFGELLNTYI